MKNALPNQLGTLTLTRDSNLSAKVSHILLFGIAGIGFASVSRYDTYAVPSISERKCLVDQHSRDHDESRKLHGV